MDAEDQSTGKQKKRSFLKFVIPVLLLSVFGIFIFSHFFGYFFYANTFKEEIGFAWTQDEYFFSVDEPGSFYFLATWSANAQVGVRPLCCTLHDTLYGEQRLYRYTFATNKTEFVNIFQPDRPDDPQASKSVIGDGDYGVLSYIYGSKLIYGKHLLTQPLYYEIDIRDNSRKQVFQNLEQNSVIKGVKPLNNGKFFACVGSMFGNPHGVFFDKAGNISRKLEDACVSPGMFTYTEKVLAAKSKPLSFYSIDNNGTVKDVVLNEALPISSPDGAFWVAWRFPERNPMQFGMGTKIAGKIVLKKLVLDEKYIRSIPDQPVFPSKWQAYWIYTKNKFINKK